MFIVTSISRADMDCGTGRLKHWSDIENERNELRAQAHKEADKTLNQQGHRMISWSNVNTAHCEHCGRQAKITNILGRDNTIFRGPAFHNACDNTEMYTSRDKWHWEFDCHME